MNSTHAPRNAQARDDAEQMQDKSLRTARAYPTAKSERTQQPDHVQDKQASEADKKQNGGLKGAFRKHPVAMIVCLGLIVAGLIAGTAWYLHARHFETTDDAFIDSRPVLVSPQITGNIVE